MRKRILVAAMAGAAVLAFGGTAMAMGADDPAGSGGAGGGQRVASATDTPSTLDDSRAGTSGQHPMEDGGAAPAPSASVPVSAARAGQIALDRVGAGRVASLELETEHGRAIWEVRIAGDGWQTRVDVDAQTGAVLRVRPDSGGRAAGDDGVSGDRGGNGGNGSDDPAGDDHGGASAGSDDPAGDDHGGDRSTSDDSSTDDHGGDRGGSDDVSAG